jgi:seryl-tRNA synthetase
MNLFQISNEYKMVMNDALMADELSEDTVKTLDNLEGLIEDKAVAIASIMKNCELEAEAVRTAIKEMQNRVKKLENKYDWLHDYLRGCLECSSFKEIRKSPHFVIKLKQNPIKVVVDNEELIGDEFKKTKEVKTIDKTAIKNAIENGVIVLGAHLEQANRVEIK